MLSFHIVVAVNHTTFAGSKVPKAEQMPINLGEKSKQKYLPSHRLVKSERYQKNTFSTSYVTET
jgi:hypothetical protein